MASRRDNREGAPRAIDHRRMLQRVECIRPMVCEKLKSMDCFLDDELPDYVLTMVANGKAEVNMIKDLSLFMGSLAEVFVDWLIVIVKENIEEDKRAVKLAVKKGTKLSRPVESDKPKLASSMSSHITKTSSVNAESTEDKALNVDKNSASTASNSQSTGTAAVVEKPRRKQAGLRLLTLAVAGANADTAKALLTATKSPSQSAGEVTSSGRTNEVVSRQMVAGSRPQSSVSDAELADNGNDFGGITVPRSLAMQTSSTAPETTGRSSDPQFIVTLHGTTGRHSDIDRDNLSGQLGSGHGQCTHLAVKRSFVQRRDSPSLPRKRQQQRCESWPQCSAGDQCENIHPYMPCRHFPNCRYGKQCLFLHPDCKYGTDCWQPECPFVHRDSIVETV